MTMSAPTVARRGVSWQEYIDLLDQPGYRTAELIDGELVVVTPTALHQQVVLRLSFFLMAWTRAATDRGEVSFELSVRVGERRGYLPDLMWYAPEQCARPGQRPAFDGPPALVVEVLSPSTRRLDAIRKRADYARIGVRELWLIDCEVPEALIARPAEPGADAFLDEVYLDGDGELASSLLPEFAVRVGDLIER